MKLPKSLAFLLDDAAACVDADAFLTGLAAQLKADGLPLLGGALTQEASHPIIARRTWLWRADTGQVIEALGFGFSAEASADESVARVWLDGLSGFPAEADVEPTAQGARLQWVMTRPLDDAEAALLSDVSRFAAAPLAVLVARSTLGALLEAYLGKRSAAQVLGGQSRREHGETIRAALLYADLRGFTPLSERSPSGDVVQALDAWFDRVAGAVHAFGGEVLKFIGDGVLAIFPIGERSARSACNAAVRAVRAAQAGMNHLNDLRRQQDAPELAFGIALHVGEIFWGNIGTADRLDFTAIGRAVNLVSRLEGLCRSLGRDVLVSGDFAAETSEKLYRLGDHELHGIAAPCSVYAIQP
ncbi:adenylate/guanylate cyclase domain-containing protein [Mesorhizobium sp. USDA-HM6]|nr:adenylate/guanylate cyclase domain-containing protein [Mesorhizobium sp. USDA-HM6]